jgi:HSP20 family protein
LLIIDLYGLQNGTQIAICNSRPEKKTKSKREEQQSMRVIDSVIHVRRRSDFDNDMSRVLSEFAWRFSAQGAPRTAMNLMGIHGGVLKWSFRVSKEDPRSLEKDILTITGERKAQGIPEDAKWIRSESVSGKFQRTVELPHPVDPKAITAELKNGILRVTLPKGEEVRPREIAIR